MRFWKILLFSITLSVVLSTTVSAQLLTASPPSSKPSETAASSGASDGKSNKVTGEPVTSNGKPKELAIPRWAEVSSKACLPLMNQSTEVNSVPSSKSTSSSSETPSPSISPSKSASNTSIIPAGEPEYTSISAKIDTIIVNKNSALVQLWCPGNHNKNSDHILTNDPGSSSVLQQFKEGDQVSLEYRQNGNDFLLQNISIYSHKLEWWQTFLIYFCSAFVLWLIIHMLTKNTISSFGLTGLMLGDDGRFSIAVSSRMKSIV
jgi:hypothetical protein